MKKQRKKTLKSKSVKKFTKGFSKLQLISGVVIAIFAVAALFFFFNKSTSLQDLNPFSEKIAITKPHPDMARARKLTIDPTKDTTMQIVTREKVKISVIIPKGSLEKKQTIEMIPYYYDKTAKTPSAGVIISPASISFKEPVTLLFDLSESPFKTDAPKNQKDKKIRYSGSSQVLTLDKEAKELIPMLIARELETSTQLRARILGGGGYVFAPQSDKQFTWAKHALHKDKVNSLSILESANALLSNKQTLTKDMRTKAEGASAKILSKKNPPASEMYAALVTKKLLQESKVSFVGTAYAIETSEGFFLAACKLDGLSVEEYVGYAKSAQLMGFESIGENCMVKAKNLVTENAQKVLGKADATLKEIITVLQDVQFLGLDEESQLDESLMQKARTTAEAEAKKVADDPNATDIEAAKELQKLDAFGIEGEVTEKLEQRLTELVEKNESQQPEAGPETPADPEDPAKPEPPKEPETTPDDYGDGTTIEEEEILKNQAMSVIGIAMLKVAGFEELDEASLKKRFEEMANGATMLNESVYALCLELGGEDCDSKHAQLAQDIDKALDESYAVSEDIGRTQSQGYDEPEYDMQLYIDPTEEPYNEQENSVEESNTEESDIGQYESSEETTESYDQEYIEDTSSYETTESTETYTESVSEE